jgi:hypothetical protein
VSVLAFVAVVVGLALVAYAGWRARRHELERQRERSRLVLDEHTAANGLYPERRLEAKASPRKLPRTPGR